MKPPAIGPRIGPTKRWQKSGAEGRRGGVRATRGVNSPMKGAYAKVDRANDLSDGLNMSEMIAPEFVRQDDPVKPAIKRNTNIVEMLFENPPVIEKMTNGVNDTKNMIRRPYNSDNGA